MEKLDMVRSQPSLYAPPSRHPVLVDVPEHRYLMADGEGDPDTSEAYADAVQALYTASYAVKFAVKRGEDPADYRVMPLQGLWWADDMASFALGDRHLWRWTMMIAQPAFVSDEVVLGAVAEARRKKALPGLEDIRLERLTEGLCAQVLHVGPYDQEGPTIEMLHAFIAERGYVLGGRHHEIYLSDPRRAAPDRLRTVLRQPVAAPA